jgi:energy-coupling factor transporter ATP-binding protein EcfA2
MPRRIEKIRIENFRGATCPIDITFDTTKSAIMIFGENGTGKSTIIDAIDFVCNAKYGSLSDSSSTQPRRHLPSLNCSATDIKVLMSADGNNWIATLDGKEPLVNGPANRPTARILRRSQILGVISAQPSERYGVIQEFIELPGIQRSEDQLREAKRIVEADLGLAVQSQEQALEALNGFWKAEGSSGGDCLKWAEKESQKDHNQLKTTVNSLQNILAAITEAIQAKTRLRNAEEQHKMAEDNSKRSEEAFNKIKSESEGPKSLSDLISILQQTDNYIKQNMTATACPVCEQGIDAKNLQNRIIQRLNSMRDAVRLKSQVDAAKRDVAGKVAIVRQCKVSLIDSIKKLSKTVSDNGYVKRIGVDWSVFLTEAKTEDMIQDEQVLELATKAIFLIERYQQEIQASHSASQKSLHQLNAIKGHFATVIEKHTAVLSLNKTLSCLSGMLDIVEKTRKGHVEGVLSAISQNVEDLYLKVHPDEGLGGIRFYLNPQYQHSLEFDGRFQLATKIPPQAYYSESHLDTLGICVFLALAKYFNDGNTVVVLDDVITSVDQAHMERFMNLLHDESGNFNQLIITTHYRPWRDRYRYARGPTGNIDLIELLHWSLPRGIRHAKTRLSIDELQGFMRQEPLDRQVVSSKAGILLESLLDHIALLYECKVARKTDPQYTLGELTDSIGKRLRKALKSQFISADGSSIISEVTLEPLLIKISGLASWIRNQVGCHWNITGLSISDVDVLALANNTVELANALVCENCGQLPLKDKTGSYFECQCGRKRLHPLNDPD